MNGIILGMRREEIHRKLDDIVQFAEIEKFLDTPVKRYSSGMYVRLAFSVAAHVDPDVLLVDEVLAVGDAKFQQRCIGKLNEVGEQGRTVMFVSHNMSLIKQLCSHTLYMKAGRLIMHDRTAGVLDRYLHDGAEGSSIWSAGSEDRQLRCLHVVNRSAEREHTNGFNDALSAVIEFCPAAGDDHFALAVRLTNEVGQDLFTSIDTDSVRRSTTKGSLHRASCDLPVSLLRPGKYYVTAILHRKEQQRLQMQEEASVLLEISDVDCPIQPGRIGLVSPLLKWKVEQINEVASDAQSMVPGSRPAG